MKGIVLAGGNGTLNEGDVDGQMRDFFHHKYISYETLSGSTTYFPLVHLGVKIAPTIKLIDGYIREEAGKAIEKERKAKLASDVAERLEKRTQPIRRIAR